MTNTTTRIGEFFKQSFSPFYPYTHTHQHCLPLALGKVDETRAQILGGLCQWSADAKR